MAAPPRGLRQVYPRPPCVSRRVRLGSPRIPSRQEDPMSDVSRREWLAVAGGLGVAATAAGGANAQGRGSADDLVRAVKGARLFDLSFTWSEQSPGLGLKPPHSVALKRNHPKTHQKLRQAPGRRRALA